MALLASLGACSNDAATDGSPQTTNMPNGDAGEPPVTQMPGRDAGEPSTTEPSSDAGAPVEQTPATACDKGSFTPVDPTLDPLLLHTAPTTVTLKSSGAVEMIKGYTSIAGALALENLAGTVGLECMERVNGLSIIGTSDTDLTGLAHLKSVDGALLYSSPSELSALAELESIDGDVLIAGGAVTSLGGLPSLTSIGGSLNVLNATLPSLGAYPALESIGEDLFISQTQLTTLGEFPAGLVVGGDVAVSPLPPSLAGFEWLEEVQGNLRFSFGAGDMAGLSNLRTVHGDFSLFDTEISSLHGLEALESVGGALTLHNTQLCDLDALSSLQSVGELTVEFNMVLPDDAATELGTRLGVSCACSQNLGMECPAPSEP